MRASCRIPLVLAFTLTAMALPVAEAGATAGNSVTCTRPAAGGKAIRCTVRLEGLGNARTVTYAFVRKGCYHPGATALNGKVALITRNDIGDGSWVLYVKPWLSPNPSLQLPFRISQR